MNPYLKAALIVLAVVVLLLLSAFALGFIGGRGAWD
jgi:hypothetical protein